LRKNYGGYGASEAESYSVGVGAWKEKKRKETLKHLTLKTTRPKRYYAMHVVL